MGERKSGQSVRLAPRRRQGHLPTTFCFGMLGHALPVAAGQTGVAKGLGSLRQAEIVLSNYTKECVMSAERWVKWGGGSGRRGRGVGGLWGSGPEGGDWSRAVSTPFELGTRYQMTHAIGLILIGILAFARGEPCLVDGRNAVAGRDLPVFRGAVRMESLGKSRGLSTWCPWAESVF